MPFDRKPKPRRRAEPSVHRTIGEISVSLRSDVPQVLDDFASLYPAGPRHPVAGGSPEAAGWPETTGTPESVIHLEVRRAGRSRLGRRLARVYADGVEVGGLRPRNGLFPLVEWGINLRVIARRPEYLQLHAASLACGGEGFIFAGDSGCGKSTLAAILMAHGWGYLCDEFALVDPPTLRLHPFPKALCIKAGSYPLVRRLGLRFARRRDHLKELKGRVGYVSPHDFGPDTIAPPTPVRFILFPKYEPGATPSLEPISRARAGLDLYRCCFNRHAFREGALPALSRLVAQARCFRLTVGEPEATVRLLESLASEPGATEVSGSPAAIGSPGATGAPAAIGAPLASASAATRAAPPAGAATPARAWRPIRGAGLPARHDPVARLASRREMLRVGAKFAYVAPTVLTLTAQQAFAAPSAPSGLCSTGVVTGGLCETDTDCCSGQCQLGFCT